MCKWLTKHLNCHGVLDFVICWSKAFIQVVPIILKSHPLLAVLYNSLHESKVLVDAEGATLSEILRILGSWVADQHLTLDTWERHQRLDYEKEKKMTQKLTYKRHTCIHFHVLTLLTRRTLIAGCVHVPTTCYRVPPTQHVIVG